jgi:hypothetical protein
VDLAGVCPPFKEMAFLLRTPSRSRDPLLDTKRWRTGREDLVDNGVEEEKTWLAQWRRKEKTCLTLVWREKDDSIDTGVEGGTWLAIFAR